MSAPVSAERDRWQKVADKDAEYERLRATYRDLTRRLGFGDNMNEPQADNDTIVNWVDEQARDADEWRESQRWRIECEVVKGHDPLDDCYECNPALRLDAALAQLGAIAALAQQAEDAEHYGGTRARANATVRVADLRAILADPAGAIAKHEQEVRADSLTAMLHAQREWSSATFGPGDRLDGVLDHITKELGEVRDNPTDVTEWIDVVILALDGAWRAGHEPEAIVAAIQAKYAKNRARTWPDWRTAEPGKAIEHVRTARAEALTEGQS